MLLSVNSDVQFNEASCYIPRFRSGKVTGGLLRLAFNFLIEELGHELERFASFR